MAQHTLSLEAPDTLNACILRLVDTSIYNSSMTVSCPELLVTYPGFTTAKYIAGVQPGFILNLTACDLGIQTNGCGTSFLPLQDGIYIIRWSVSPNASVYAEYNHLRITAALNRMYKILCELDQGACEPTATVHQKFMQLNYIRMRLLAAKAKVEICHEPDKGMQIFNYAVKLLDKMSCRTCTK